MRIREKRAGSVGIAGRFAKLAETISGGREEMKSFARSQKAAGVPLLSTAALLAQASIQAQSLEAVSRLFRGHKEIL